MPGKRLFLTGDEAVARAALECGIDVATGYPGNPSTKAITALIPIARQYDIAIEWSVNEKVALEVATGAAWAGKRSFVAMKMSGVNVMADSLLSIAHSGVRGALVIYAVDDVGVYYGMVEQDTRYYAQLASLPLLMPTSPEEAYSMTRLAFALSEQTGAPVFVLGTTAVANAITAMKVGQIERDKEQRPASFPRDLAKFTKAAPQWCRDQHSDAIKRLELAGELARKMASEVNYIVGSEPVARGQAQGPHSSPHPPLVPTERRETGKRLGIMVAGVSFSYLQELRQRAPQWFADVPVLKLGMVHPLPRQEIEHFLSQVDSVVILEELDPLIETQVLAIIAENELHVRVHGKRNGLLPRVGDYSLELIQNALAALDEQMGRAPVWTRPRQVSNAPGMQEMPAQQASATSLAPKGKATARVASTMMPTQQNSATSLAPARSLEFCPGCPHRMTYYALNRAIEQLGYTQDEVITTGDVGCTIIGMNAPLDTCWTEVSMGASIGIAQGMKQAGIERPVLAAMGDGTFYHNGIAGLLNAVQSGVNLTLLILDNSHSAMTGMQPDAGTGRRTDGSPALRADIAMIARGCGVEYVKRLDPYQLPEMIATLQDAMRNPGVSVVIAEAPCTTQGVYIHEPVQVDQQACMAGRGCEDTPCYSKVGCPSVLLSLDNVKPLVSIDSATCVACGLCVDACPYDAIKPIEQLSGRKSPDNSLFAGVQLRHMVQE
ncbi:MAG TPA: indolepyruvate ferredoxin oxidoreductase subunit alpha, partial [Ktedonobacteraceae bacterium]|nr:indolepyruvate ferredoxin oxidoreductase subunit alpha [Ktedonobacteraceae bacterium]